MKKKHLITAISGILTMLITGIMDFILLPSIEKGTEGMRFFDMNSFGYSYENAKAFISSLSDKGTQTALHIQLPLDFVYPIIYTVFFISLIFIISGKKSKLAVFPILLFISDYIENICSIIMLKADSLSKSLVTFASTVTVIKSGLMTATFLIIMILIIKRVIGNKSVNKSETP